MTGLPTPPRPSALGAALAAALAAAAVWAAGGASGPAGAAEEPSAPARVEAAEALIGDDVRDHPEVARDALQTLAELHRAEDQERRRMSVRLLAKELNHDPASPVAGNEAGDVTLVEFFDYRCPYCKAVSPGLRRLIEEDRNLRLVFKEFPILGAESTFAARAALAAHRQGKYAEFHFALMSVRAGLSEGLVMRVAERVGLDVERLRSDMEAPELDAVITRNRALAEKLGIRGTPAFVIGETVIPGAVEMAELKALIANERGG